MKFIVTGSIQSSRGPRLIVSCALIFIILFIAAHAVREIQATGFYPAQIRENLGGEGKSFVLILEDLHIDIFLFSMALLFLFSILYQTGLSIAAKNSLIYASFFSALINVVSRAACVWTGEASYLVFISFLLLHISLALLCIIAFYHMYIAENIFPG